MANLKAEFHEHLTRLLGVKYDEEMNICLLESLMEMSKSHANDQFSCNSLRRCSIKLRSSIADLADIIIRARLVCRTGPVKQVPDKLNLRGVKCSTTQKLLLLAISGANNKMLTFKSRPLCSTSSMGLARTDDLKET